MQATEKIWYASLENHLPFLSALLA